MFRVEAVVVLNIAPCEGKSGIGPRIFREHAVQRAGTQRAILRIEAIVVLKAMPSQDKSDTVLTHV